LVQRGKLYFKELYGKVSGSLRTLEEEHAKENLSYRNVLAEGFTTVSGLAISGLTKVNNLRLVVGKLAFREIFLR
jgi:hypothetical protein